MGTKNAGPEFSTNRDRLRYLIESDSATGERLIFDLVTDLKTLPNENDWLIVQWCTIAWEFLKALPVLFTSSSYESIEEAPEGTKEESAGIP